jgi:hypothetical protein
MRTLDLLAECAEAYIAQSGDYTIDSSMYDFSGFVLDGTPPLPPTGPSQRARRRTKLKAKRETDFEPPVELTSLTSHYLKTGGLAKGNAKRQASSCAQTATCFGTCPYCAVQNALCDSSSAAVLARVACGTLGAATSTTLGVEAVNALCLPLSGVCGPAALGCLTACISLMPALVGAIAYEGCSAIGPGACNYATSQCKTCDAANNNICSGGTAQCCPGETGTECGSLASGERCCCCPECQAPSGPDCACAPAAC